MYLKRLTLQCVYTIGLISNGGAYAIENLPSLWCVWQIK